MEEITELEREIDFLLSSETGRSLAFKILDECRIFTSSFDSCPYKTAFNEGRRSFGLFLMDSMKNLESRKVNLMFRENIIDKE